MNGDTFTVTVDVARTLEALSDQWGRAYVIGWNGTRWHASRVDGTGDTLRGLTPDDLVAAMRAELAVR